MKFEKTQYIFYTFAGYRRDEYKCHLLRVALFYNNQFKNYLYI